MNNDDRQTRYERGMAKIAEIFGDVDVNAVDAVGDLGRLIAEFAYGDIYSSESLPLRERQIATIAILTAMGGREFELRVHMQAALNAGMTPQELEALIIHTVPYAGFPTAMDAMRTLKQLVQQESRFGAGAVGVDAHANDERGDS